MHTEWNFGPWSSLFFWRGGPVTTPYFISNHKSVRASKYKFMYVYLCVFLHIKSKLPAPPHCHAERRPCGRRRAALVSINFSNETICLFIYAGVGAHVAAYIYMCIHIQNAELMERYVCLWIYGRLSVHASFLGPGRLIGFPLLFYRLVFACNFSQQHGLVVEGSA